MKWKCCTQKWKFCSDCQFCPYHEQLAFPCFPCQFCAAQPKSKFGAKNSTITEFHNSGGTYLTAWVQKCNKRNKQFKGIYPKIYLLSFIWLARSLVGCFLLLFSPSVTVLQTSLRPGAVLWASYVFQPGLASTSYRAVVMESDWAGFAEPYKKILSLTVS